MNINKRKFLKGGATLLGISVVPYSGFYAYRKLKSNSVLAENDALIDALIDDSSTMPIDHDLGNVNIELSDEDVELISGFNRNENSSKIYNLIKSDYAHGRTLYSNSFNYSITEIKIAIYRRSITNR
tara:strand:- start:146420 stop:146800 length:381 start_codon:yes stop_codon:yes gene_type:complete